MLSGKVMFRNVVYVTEDYSVRVVDGIVKFRYWLQYVKKQLNEGKKFKNCIKIIFYSFTLYN